LLSSERSAKTTASPFLSLIALGEYSDFFADVRAVAAEKRQAINAAMERLKTARRSGMQHQQ